MRNRRHIRYLPPDGTIAVLRPVGERVGPVKDIGPDGLSFEHLVLETHKEIPKGDHPSPEIDVFWPNRKTHLPAMKCTVVWEHGVLQNRDYATGHIAFKRVGVQFKGLTFIEHERLNEFLSECRPVQRLKPEKPGHPNHPDRQDRHP